MEKSFRFCRTFLTLCNFRKKNSASLHRKNLKKDKICQQIEIKEVHWNEKKHKQNRKPVRSESRENRRKVFRIKCNRKL